MLMFALLLILVSHRSGEGYGSTFVVICRSDSGCLFLRFTVMDRWRSLYLFVNKYCTLDLYVDARMLREKHELGKRWKRRRLAMTVIAARLGRRTTPPPKERLVTLDACPGNHTNFFCANGVPTSNYGVVVRYLLSDPVRCELYKHLIKRSHPMRQRESQINKQCAEEVAKLGRRAYVSERDLVALLAGGVASREVHRAIGCRIHLLSPKHTKLPKK
ncbi:hypothetical protein T08_7816, partial [Trichinella sp. T8]